MRWLGAFLIPLLLAAADAPRLAKLPPGKTFLVIMPHHDDHTHEYGLGGLIARMVDEGYRGRYVRVTNDEKDGANGWGRNDLVNEKETAEATRVLGIDEAISLNWRNDHMSSIPVQDLRAQLILLIRKYRPDVVMSYDPWGHYDRNPDHRMVSRAVAEAVWLARYSNCLPEHAAMGLKPHRVPYLYYSQRSDYGRGHRPNVAIELTEDQVRRKARAYWLHRNVRVNPGAARRVRQELDARGLKIPDLDGLGDEEAAIRLQEWRMFWISARRGKESGAAYAETVYFMDEWSGLPGLAPYLAENAVTK
ncbi:MAG: PIG-L family deacetylase [Bryobacteraceae bacterium]|nr:PIG-L family deacetylase [Bryobacteraceae bacterium]